jgi:hypothetical protein
MPQVFGVHRVELRHGVTPEQLEAFVREQVDPATDQADVSFHILRADRGGRSGAYLMLVRMASVGVRNRLWPETDQASAAGIALVRMWADRWYELVSKVEEAVDYVEIGRG